MLRIRHKAHFIEILQFFFERFNYKKIKSNYTTSSLQIKITVKICHI